jgi:hypothetical protein
MAISFATEKTMSLSAAARMLPPGRGGRPVSLSCVLRWVLNGVRAKSGEVVRLEAVRLGARWVTSVEALERFTERLTPDLGAEPTRRTTAAQRTRASERAEKALEEIGL